MPDSLPPVSTVFRSDILLAGPHKIDADRVVFALTARALPTNPARPWVPTADGMKRDWPGGGATVAVVAQPLSATALAKPIEDASSWWPAERARDHTHVVVIQAHSTEHSAAIVARVLTRLTAAVIDTMVPESVLGVLFGGERLYPADFVQAAAEEDPPLLLLMAVHVGKDGEPFALRTSGLPALGLMNIEVEPVPGADLQAMAESVKQIAAYLVEAGPVISDGDTLGNSTEEQMRITHRPASWGGETVYRLAFVGGVPDGLSAVKCPQCRKEVRASVSQVGPVMMLEKCPNCGVGPIALLEEMIQRSR